tara:strand:+ start:3843 stop:4130 length:288 start_codon:yes stop_codon:yes gene_type:complete
MSLHVYKVNLTGYVIRNTDIMDDPNHIDLNTVIEMVLDNQHECTMDLIDSIGDTGCDCTECTCGAKTESTPLMMNLGEPGTSADTSVIGEESMTI